MARRRTLACIAGLAVCFGSGCPQLAEDEFMKADGGDACEPPCTSDQVCCVQAGDATCQPDKSECDCSGPSDCDADYPLCCQTAGGSGHCRASNADCP